MPLMFPVYSFVICEPGEDFLVLPDKETYDKHKSEGLYNGRDYCNYMSLMGNDLEVLGFGRWAGELGGAVLGDDLIQRIEKEIRYGGGIGFSFKCPLDIITYNSEDGRFPKRVFLTKELEEIEKKAFFKGMGATNMGDLKEIIVNGIESFKTKQQTKRIEKMIKGPK